MIKSGIDYFPLDVSMDAKMELIEAEFGLTGFGVVVHLLQEIYGKAGYYIEWTEEVALLFARKVGLGGGVVSEIIEASVRRGMFDKEKYDKYHVLTSRGIQKRYFEAVSRRKVLEVDESILLVNVTQICKYVDIKRKNVNIFEKNADISKQSKGEKSNTPISPKGDFERFWNAYPRHTAKANAVKAFKKLEPDEALIDTMLKAIEVQKKSEQWQRDNGQYIPHPSTWLNQRRWEDEMEVKQKNDGIKYYDKYKR